MNLIGPEPGTLEAGGIPVRPDPAKPDKEPGLLKSVGPTKWPTILVLAGWSIVVLGMGLRVSFYQANRSLWLDESLLVNNIVQRSYSGLLRPLDGVQGAPIGFLLLEKLVTHFAGVSEYSLRALPLAGGLISVVLFYTLLRRCTSPRVALPAIALFALCGPLIYYSAEAKQYSGDVATALAIMVLAGRGLSASPDHRSKWLVSLGLVGCAALWVSHPAVFVLAGVAAVLLISFFRDRDLKGVLVMAADCTAFAASFVVLYLRFLRTLAANPGLKAYWVDGFPPRSPGAINWLFRAWLETCRLPGGFFSPTLAAACALIGAIALLGKQRRVLALFVAPVILTLLAAALHQFPFQGRIVLFIVPALIFLVAQGADSLWNLPGLPRHAAWVIVVFVLLAYPLRQIPEWLGKGDGHVLADLGLPPREQIRPVAQFIAANCQSGDVICVYPLAEPAYQFYAPLCHLDALAREPWPAGNDEQETRTAWKNVPAHPRIWFVFSHTNSLGNLDEEKVARFFLAGRGHQLQNCQMTGASTCLYDLRP